MSTTFGEKKKVIQQSDGTSGSNIINNTNTPRNVPSANGTRIQPKDTYVFVGGSRAIFMATFLDTDKPIQVDTATTPYAIVRQNGCQIAEQLNGSLVPGQLYEYQFAWDIPINLNNYSTYTIEYFGYLGGALFVWGMEYFTVNNSPQNIKLKEPAYATVDQLRLDKFNIDSFLPKVMAQDKPARDEILHHYLITATKELQGKLNLRDFHSAYNDNFNLYTRYYSIWLILGQAQGEEGSAVSDRSLKHWEDRWKSVLKQIKMHSQLSNIPAGRA